MFVQGRLFRFFKWTMDFSPSTDSPIIPVWIALPGLPVNFFIEHLLRSIAGNIGRVLKIDPLTLNLTQTNVARVCIDLDISLPLPPRVCIELAKTMVPNQLQRDAGQMVALNARVWADINRNKFKEHAWFSTCRDSR